MRTTPTLFAFNRGVVSRLGLARVDLERMRLSAEEQTNWMPRTLGSMSIRPGLGYLGSTLNDQPACCIPFVYEADDLARLELTAGWLRVWIDDAPLVRPAVSTAIANGDFAAGLSGWTDADETGAVSAWSDGRMTLKGTGETAARRRILVSVSSPEKATEHAVRVAVQAGPVTLRIGAAAGDDDILGETTLATGDHSLAFTPHVTTVHVEVSHRGEATSALESIGIEPPGELRLATAFGADDIARVRWAQSRDVVFLACDGRPPKRIERRAARSWSIVDYLTEDGPFLDENLSRVTLAPSGLSGDVTLTASADLFRAGHAGALFRISSSGQRVEESVAAEDTFSGEIRVTGVGDDRKFIAKGSGGSGTVTLQRSVGEPGVWEDVQTVSAASTTIDDGLDNQIIYYRIGVKAGDFVSGPIQIGLTFARGAIEGIARIVAVASPTSASAVVLKPFGATTPSAYWAEGAWSDVRGWPTAVRLFEGRLWWGGRGRLWGSVSDAFHSFDDTLEGDAGPIAKTISDGPSDVVAWIEAGARMLVGTIGGVFEARASALDEPLTPSACQLRRISTMGAANLPAVPVDLRVHFVQRAGRELLEALAGDGGRIDAARLTALAPEIGEPGILRIAVQHQPDVRIHCVRADGAAAVLLIDPAEEVRCWIEVRTDGVIEDVTVLPDGEEDAVYYVVRRQVGGSTRRYHERWAPESACRGGDICRLADSHIVYDGGRTNVLSGLDHLEGRTVRIWADGAERTSATVSGGEVPVSGEACARAVVGLGYEARFRSAKLAYGGRTGATLAQPKRVNRLGLVLADVHSRGLRYGPDFDALDPLPTPRPFEASDADAVYRDYDFDGAAFPGRWSTDARVCLVAEAPRPCTVLGLAVDLETVER